MEIQEVLAVSLDGSSGSDEGRSYLLRLHEGQTELEKDSSQEAILRSGIEQIFALLHQRSSHSLTDFQKGGTKAMEEICKKKNSKRSESNPVYCDLQLLYSTPGRFHTFGGDYR